MTRRPPPPVFVIKLVAAPGVDSIRALRALLKILLRQFGLRCVSAREQRPDLFRDYRGV
jgi:hypothetical protein